jgi:small-conductance mechanosensitive channel
MSIETWALVLNQSFQDLFYGLVWFVPNLIVALIIFLVGWLIGAGLGRVVAQVVTSLKVDAALKSVGVDTVTKRAGIELSSGKFLGALVKWFFIIVFLVAALDVLGLSQVNAFLSGVVLGYLPNVIAAVLILLIAAVVANAARDVVTTSARAANIRSAGFLGSVSRWSVWIFAILAALAQLNVAEAFVQTLFTGIVVAVSLAIGLAFGLGGQDAAAKYIASLKGEISHRD